ncbi:MAG: hypothetical protein AB1652_08170 [Bacillota bacterium]
MITVYDLQKLQNKVTWGNQDIQKTLIDLRYEITTMFVISLAVNTFLAALVVWAVAK